jgi:hypothetical protein
MKQSLDTLKQYFDNWSPRKFGISLPGKTQFKNLIDSFRHKDEQILQSEVKNLNSRLSTIEGMRLMVNVLEFNADNTGVQDSTEAVNNAMEYARQLGVNHIFFPKGSYRMNIEVEENMRITGPGGGIRLNYSIPSSFPESEYPIVIRPFDPALPVIKVVSVYGVHLSDFMLQTSHEQINISGATNASTIVITTSAPHGLSSGDCVFIGNVGGNTNANGTYFVTVLSSTTYQLFIDSARTVPRAGNASYTSGGYMRAKKGEGLTISNDANFPGSSMTVSRVSIRGFFTGLANYGGCDITYNECLFGSSYRNVGLYPAADTAPSDTQNFNNCVTGGHESTWNFYFIGGRGVSVFGGDHNMAKHLMYIQSGGVVNWINANSEQIQEHLFELNAGYLNIAAGRFNVLGGLGGNDALIHVTGPTVDYSINQIAYDGNGSGWLGSNYGTLVKTAGNEYPRTAPKGFLIQRYTNNTFTTLRKTELTSIVYRNTAEDDDQVDIIDNFINNYTSPFGALGWLITTTGGLGGTGRFPTSSVQSLEAGALEFVTASGSGSDRFRLALAREIISANLKPFWEMELKLNVSNSANTILRAGLFTNDVATVTGATNATPIVMTTSAAHGLDNGMPVFIAGVGGNTNANGSYFAKRLTSTTFELYTDSGLTTGRAGNGAYTSGGTTIAATPGDGVGIGFNGVSDTNIFSEYYSAGVVTRTNTNVAHSALSSSTNATSVKIRKISSAANVHLGYTIQIGDNPEITITSSIAAEYLIPAIYLGSANANFATARIDRFTLRF